MKIDESKIEAKKVSLGADWIVVNGMHAITTAEFKGDSTNFNPAQGILVKTFINNKTGEMKFFPIILFKKDEA